jgi:glycosyltransferase involved in cell wall biosynthesis
MIAKQEAETMAQSIESVLDVVDEVIVGADDSSTDATAEIGRKYASPGKYYEFTWENDFSKARNDAIAKATGDYCLILDPHEFMPADDDPVLPIMAKMRNVDVTKDQLLTPLSCLTVIRQRGLPDAFDVGCFSLIMNIDAHSTPQLFFLQPRIFRNNGKIHYESAVHNFLAGYRDGAAMGIPECILVHNMPPAREAQRKKQRAKMNFSGLKDDIAKNPDDPRPYFYLGNSYADMGHPASAIKWYKKYLSRSTFGEEKYQALQQLAVLMHRHAGNEDAARKYLAEAMGMQWQRAEPYVLLGEMAEKGERWEEAIHWYDMAKHIKAPDTVMFLQGPVYSYLPDLKQMSIYAKTKKWDEAIGAAQRVLQWAPAHQEVLADLEQFKRLWAKENKGSDRNLLIVDRLGSFTADLGNFMTGEFNVVRRSDADGQWIAWSDAIFCEWCDQSAIELSRQQRHCPMVVRLHSYEAFSDMPGKVYWENVDHLIFVADHIRDLFIQRFPDAAGKVDMSVIPNGVKTDGWRFKKRTHGTKIALLSYLNHKKGIETLAEVIKAYPRYEFHIAGQWQDPHLEYFFNHEMQAWPNFFWHGWIEPHAKADWLNDMDYLLSTSIVESFQYAIAEAMMSGIKPLIRQRPGALYSPCTWTDVADIGRLLQPDSPYESEQYRDFIVEHFQAEARHTDVRDLLNALVAHYRTVEADAMIA